MSDSMGLAMNIKGSFSVLIVPNDLFGTNNIIKMVLYMMIYIYVDLKLNVILSIKK